MHTASCIKLVVGLLLQRMFLLELLDLHKASTWSLFCHPVRIVDNNITLTIPETHRSLQAMLHLDALKSSSTGLAVYYRLIDNSLDSPACRLMLKTESNPNRPSSFVVCKVLLRAF